MKPVAWMVQEDTGNIWFFRLESIARDHAEKFEVTAVPLYEHPGDREWEAMRADRDMFKARAEKAEATLAKARAQIEDMARHIAESYETTKEYVDDLTSEAQKLGMYDAKPTKRHGALARPRSARAWLAGQEFGEVTERLGYPIARRFCATCAAPGLEGEGRSKIAAVNALRRKVEGK